MSAIHITERNAPAFHLTDSEVLAQQRQGRGFTLTRSLCYAIGTDVANRQMREAGRSRWNADDASVAAETTVRHMVLGGFLPAEVYEHHVGEPFPYVLGNDGAWIAPRPPRRKRQPGAA